MIEEFDPTDPTSLFEGPSAPAPIKQAFGARRKVSNLQDSFLQTIKIFLPIAAGLILIVFGLTSSGSFYTPATRFGGVFAEFFYGWQAGTFAAMIGTILIYDAIKRSGYL